MKCELVESRDGTSTTSRAPKVVARHSPEAIENALPYIASLIAWLCFSHACESGQSSH
eukprot:CAMPEP_0206318478 /NCGR_PEP_ID=MMETSP0106_2-20121207/17209_1 /ASSEMBLY_ACC=CAM_ASM_000206 /TAXON_ID=81532 /ORGANISM="Acanthoeca-like sp., Strain 10tr" /LENGTH=57 /DNA_ID=CAMNT_0053750177 /DNA_START=29 /DNA_END=199 /DNA_ORIENTATION=+